MSNLRQTPLTCSGHTRPVVHLAFSSVTESGYYLISACKDGKPMLRQGDTGDWIGTFEGHKGAVWGVALNSLATRAATAAADFTAKVWDALSGDELQSFVHQHIVKSVDFSGDSSQLVTGSNKCTLKIFDLNKPESESQELSGHTAAVKHVLFFRNDSHLLSCGDDRTLRVWDRSSNQEVQKVDLPSVPSSMEISKDGSIVTVAAGQTVSFWDSARLEKLKEFTLPSLVHSASLHPDKSAFVWGGDDFKVYKYDYADGSELDASKGHFGPVHCIRFSPDGELYASGSEDGTLRLWQTTVGKTYGLWKCVDAVVPPIMEGSNPVPTIPEVPAN